MMISGKTAEKFFKQKQNKTTQKQKNRREGTSERRKSNL